MAGYSGTPLVKKLGLKPGQRVVFLKAPEGYAQTLSELPSGLRPGGRLAGEADFIQLFASRQSSLAVDFPKARDHLAPDGALWVSWPKRSSGVATDLDENVVRAMGLNLGLVDVKVCAVDATWSGLKFVYRLQHRPK